MYTLSNLIVVEKMENIKTTTNRSTLNFSHRTVVVRVENPSFPLKPFCLNPIPELLAAKKLDDSQLLDIIGEVVGKEDPRDIITSKGKETKCMVVVIADLEVEPLIVVLQFFKPSRWNGLRSCVQSGAAELKRGGVVVKSIEDALNSTKGPIWIGGTIVSIDAGNNDWFYKSCRKCPKKVETQIENRYECSKCGHTHGSASLKCETKLTLDAFNRFQRTMFSSGISDAV
ncbi:replication protein A 70 kDa DNA-binding subunit A-like isoform [Arachis hypogaea]|uniref:Replication protein A 70 kDa DNA-binding subunit A-like isoform n=1 Tax=Arachis hypogaea TaxID=3818 RepID=A0A6B9V6T0_ARAHY|nr:replication protein A 70 kDa DNA-binding subunit A-like isoform [Arachis hypogaea]